MEQKDLQQKRESDTSKSKPRLTRRSPTTFKKELSDEQFEKLANRTTERMVKSLHEAKPD